MYIRNCLKANDYVCVLPIGLRLTLQYNSEGNLENVYKGFSSDRETMPSLILPLLNNGTIPRKIHITKGTTWIKGILYTGQLFYGEGILPESVESDLLKRYEANPSQFNFFAGTLESSAIPVKGHRGARQALTLSKFRLLPGLHIPATINDKLFKDLLYNDKFPFSEYIITGYIIFRGNEVLFPSTKLRQFIAEKTVKYVDEAGHIKARVYIKGDDSFVVFDYPEVIKHNIHSKSLVIIDGDHNIVYVFNQDNTHKKQDASYICTHCGKVFKLPNSGAVTCTNAHCPSLLVTPVQTFLSDIGLPVPDTSVINEWIVNGSLHSLSDLFVLPEYQEAEVEISLSKLLRALIPTSLIYKDDIFILFEDKCLKSIETFLYYINNVDRITEDFAMFHKDLPKLIDWLSDSYNISDLLVLLDSPQICIIQRLRKFEGAPIFRNKTIFITGEFVRGSLSEINSILESYAASVVLSFSNLVDCVLVGGKRENIDGNAVQSARNLNIPVMQEEEFFKQYEIDKDLQQL